MTQHGSAPWPLGRRRTFAAFVLTGGVLASRAWSGSDVDALAGSSTVATLLPGAEFSTRSPYPDARRLLDAGVTVALATDCNPGTSPMSSILLALNMGATLFRLTVQECLIGATRNAAVALGLGDEIGTLEAGKACDLAIWDADDPAVLVYRMGFNPLWARVRGGR